MKKKSRFLQTPIEPFAVEAGLSADQILARMERISFQGRNLATAHRIWLKMLQDDVTIFMGMAGALSAGGLRMVVAHLILHRYVDCLVSTGANLYHDLHETRGQHHYVGSPHADDAALAEERIDRVYDTYASEEEFISNDNWIADFAATLEARPYTTREFLHLLGGHLWKTTNREGILTAAFRANVPIFCPAIADSSIGMGLSQARQKTPGAGHIDIIGDIVESANLVIRRPRTASSVVLGGGTPKNFINQASVQAEFYSDEVGGHRYALQIVTDVPHFGGASGSSLEEAQSWGKLATDSARVSVQADATIALPLLASALAITAPPLLAKRTAPVFTLAGRVMTVDGQTVPNARFVEEVNEPTVQYDQLALGEFGGTTPTTTDFANARVVILPVPLDRTTSYVSGTRNGPHEILVASSHMELWDEETQTDVHSIGIFTLPEMEFPFAGMDEVVCEIRRVASELIKRGKFPLILGGEHSLTPAVVGAVAAKHPGLSVLQIDAHADLRDSFMGTPHNHACAMRRTLDFAPTTQVGIRSLSPEEAAAAPGLRTTIFYDYNMRADPRWIDRVVESLSDTVYITIDVDGLDPAIMPATGTPEPGGLSWYETLALLRAVIERRTVVGCDIVELSPMAGNVAPNFLCAKLIYKILSYRFGTEVNR